MGRLAARFAARLASSRAGHGERTVRHGEAQIFTAQIERGRGGGRGRRRRRRACGRQRGRYGRAGSRAVGRGRRQLRQLLLPGDTVGDAERGVEERFLTEDGRRRLGRRRFVGRHVAEYRRRGGWRLLLDARRRLLATNKKIKVIRTQAFDLNLGTKSKNLAPTKCWID